MNFPSYLRSLHTNIIKKQSKTTEKQSQIESLTTFKSTSMFLSIDKIFYNHHFISTHLPHCNTQNHFYLPKKIIFCYFVLNSTRTQFRWLPNYSHYLTKSTSNITPLLPLHTSQPTPNIYNATALLTHAWYTCLVHRLPNIRSHSVLFSMYFSGWNPMVLVIQMKPLQQYSHMVLFI